MKKILSYFSIIFFILFLSNCGDKKPDEESADKKDRNMFGHYIPRGLTIKSDSLMPGFAMFSPSNSPYTYLVNRNGEVVHEWKGSYAAFNTYLLDDGSVLQGANDPDYPVFGFGGPYGRIQKISWEGKMLWDFEYADTTQILHHDFAVMPNGNILALAYETSSYEYALALGRKPEYIPRSGPWMEKIIEIEPQGARGFKIVWEWRVEDHLIQDFDETKPNYGNPQEHPELFNFNLGDSIPARITQDSLDILKAMGRGGRNLTLDNPHSDIYHFNALNYNPELDQIAFSSPELSEVYIIDHSVTTEEAAGHRGGKSGRGGDLLYRWGNPENYMQGDSTDRKLYYQHDIRWIEKGKPGAGNLTLYNNAIPMGPDSLSYSAIHELNPVMTEDGNYEMLSNGRFGPEEPVWNYVAKDTISFYGSFISGAHRMENGNTFINEGPKGRLFEVTPDREVVWEYLVPYRGNIHKPNGEPRNMMRMTYSTFRATFIPADHPALEGKELKPIDPQPEPFVMPPPPPEEDKKE
ncbi:aryl-sulfate sulfotransferase [uncultured Eudoraea sp.]|uniref:aryl-sulfate sulfotransferase n=1 Tax=uncultured Eudoraea sp. TaxID=1035614 RepID=UPI00262D1D43|nr:aryl-sulfate sulfotransferase [uncultured Eudoraea sp.]